MTQQSQSKFTLLQFDKRKEIACLRF